MKNKNLGAKQPNILRIKTEADIPMFLLNSILVINDCIRVIGKKEVSYPLNSVIRWDVDPSEKTLYTIKCINKEVENLIEENGAFYERIE